MLSVNGPKAYFTMRVLYRYNRILFQIKLPNSEQKVCKMAIWNLHGIENRQLERICMQLTTNITASKDLREKHSTRPNSIPENIVKQVHNNIRSFPHRESYYSREKSKRCYLSADLNISWCIHCTLKSMKNDVLSVFKAVKKVNYLVSYDYCFRYFKENFNFSFGTAVTY